MNIEFYKPDPALSAWRKEDQKLKRDGKSKKDRPKKPARNPDYPTKQEMALNLLETFKKQFPNITIRSILADALYGTKQFMDKASDLFGGAQVISQLKKNQNVRVNGKKISLEQYFSSPKGRRSALFSRRNGRSHHTRWQKNKSSNET